MEKPNESEDEVEDTSDQAGSEEPHGDEHMIDEALAGVPEEELTEEVYKQRMIAMLAEKRMKEEELMASLKPIKTKAAKKKKSKGKITLTALKTLPGDMHLMEYNLVDVKVRQK